MYLLLQFVNNILVLSFHFLQNLFLFLKLLFVNSPFTTNSMRCFTPVSPNLNSIDRVLLSERVTALANSHLISLSLLVTVLEGEKWHSQTGQFEES